MKKVSQRQAHWERVYREKSPEAVSWYQNKPKLSLALIERSGITKNDALIDIGGGASTLVDYLLADGYENLAVLDISQRALAYAQTRLGARATSVFWIRADITTFHAPQTYALWHDRAVFHFLTEPSDRARYISTLESSLEPNGHLIIAAFALNGPEQCSGLEIVRYDADKLGNTLGSAFELVETASEIHQTPDGGEQQFGYYRYCYRP